MKKLLLMLCVLAVCLAGMSGCGNVSYDGQNFLTSRVDSYSYSLCVDTGSTDTTLNREFEGFHGKDTIWKLSAAEGTQIPVEVSATVTDGQFKILLIGPDQSITTLLEGNGTEQFDVELKEGTSRIILVGEKSKGSCEVTVGEGQNVTVNPLFLD